MKVVCPECSSDFDVPQEMLEPRGKRVRCSNCHHIWLQEPQAEQPYGNFRHMEESLEIDPIPLSVHPRTDEDDDDEDDETAEKGPSLFAGINIGYLMHMLAGAALGIVVMTVLITGAKAAGHPLGLFAPFYAPKPVEARQEPLKFESVSILDAKGAAGPVTLVVGRLINASASEQMMPALDFIPVDASGSEGEGMRMKPDTTALKPGANIDFRAKLQGSPPEGGHIRIVLVR